MASTGTPRLRRVTRDEFDDLFAFARSVFHAAAPPDDRDAELAIFEAERSIGLFDGDTIVGSAAAYTRDLTVPGGPVPAACVTWVTVAPTHTRRGLLTRMMRHQLTELYEEQREPVAVLWASESGIYGRYGYGMGSRHARISANTYEVKLAHPVPPAERRIRLGEASNPKLRADIEAVYDRARPTLVGHCDRRDRWWDFRLHDPERDRSGATPLRAALHDGAAGADGYALFAVRGNWSSNGPDGEVQVHELVAENPEAHAALWAFLFDTDLVTKLSWRIAPADAPLVHLVDDPRRITVSTIDNLWVRVVDVGRALATRRYAAPVDVVVDVTDAFCPWNTGRWRLAGGPDGAVCARTDAAADLALSSTELGAAYLGGTTFAALAAVGRVQELRAGAVRAASTAFAEPRQPYCPEVF